MPERTRAKDASSLHKYRIELPVLIDDMGLSVYAFRLYAHIKRRAGEQGSCWEGTRALAIACGMSVGRVSEAKDELERAGLITRNIKAVRGGIADDISIVDMWPETFKHYAPESERPNESVHQMNTSTSKCSSGEHLPESVHQMNTSDKSVHVVDTLTSKRSPGELKNHDLPYNKDLDPPPPPPNPPTPNGGGGGDRKKTAEPEVTDTESYLLDEEFLAETAREFAAIDLATARYWVPKLKKGGLGPGAIVKQWRRRPPPAPPPPPAANGYTRPLAMPADTLAPEAARALLVQHRKKERP